MTVYVDDMRASYGRLLLCHMLASSDAELHELADQIGLARKHWQRPTNTSGSHYDICLSKRAMAIAAGAVGITMRQAAAMKCSSEGHLRAWHSHPHYRLDAPIQCRAPCSQEQP